MPHLPTLLLTLALIGSAASAQTFSGTISTVPADSTEAPAPVPFATVFLPSLKQGTMADSNGSFTIGNLPAGQYAVEYSCIGYTTLRDTITIAPKATSLTAAIAQAQEGAASDVVRHVALSALAIRLPEVVVGSTDENPALYAIRCLNESNAANLRRIASFQATCNEAVTQNLSSLPEKIVKMLKVVLFLTPYRKLFNLFMDYPELSYAARYDVAYNGKKEQKKNFVLTRCTPTIEAKEEKTLLKLFEEADGCLYYLEEQKTRTVHPSQWGYFEWTLTGTYMENGRTVDVVKCAPKESPSSDRHTAYYHIVHLDEDPATAIPGITHALLRMSTRQHKVEFREVAPNLFLPVSELDNQYLDAEDKTEMQQYFDEQRDSLAQMDMSARQRAKSDKKIAEEQKMFDDLSQLSVKTASSIQYHNVTVR